MSDPITNATWGMMFNMTSPLSSVPYLGSFLSLFAPFFALSELLFPANPISAVAFNYVLPFIIAVVFAKIASRFLVILLPALLYLIVAFIILMVIAVITQPYFTPIINETISNITAIG